MPLRQTILKSWDCVNAYTPLHPRISSLGSQKAAQFESCRGMVWLFPRYASGVCVNCVGCTCWLETSKESEWDSFWATFRVFFTTTADKTAHCSPMEYSRTTPKPPQKRLSWNFLANFMFHVCIPKTSQPKPENCLYLSGQVKQSPCFKAWCRRIGMTNSPGGAFTNCLDEPFTDSYLIQ